MNNGELHYKLLQIARSDATAAKMLATEGLLSHALFFFEQSLEKSLKAILVYDWGISDPTKKESQILHEIKGRYGHNNRKAAAEIIERIALLQEQLRPTDKKHSKEDLELFKESIDMIKSKKFDEPKMIREYPEVVKKAYQIYKNREMQELFADQSGRFILLSTCLALPLAFVEDAARYPLSKHDFENIRILNQDGNRKACEMINEMTKELLNIVSSMISGSQNQH